MEALIYFVAWGALIFLMMRFGCGAHVMGHGGSHSGMAHREDHRSPAEGLRWMAPEMDVDPVCGMTVRTKGARSSVYEGQVYYFCSQDCREKFEAAPQTYLKTKPQLENPKTEAADV